MKDLAALLRALQLTAHMQHNLITGKTFFSDHEMLADLYGAYETAYDSVVERMIGTSGMKPQELVAIQESALELVKMASPTNDADKAFAVLLHGEKEIQALCKTTKGSVGTLNLIAQLADDSEVRAYKLQQRLLK